ncbi:MAG: hypothetical protein OEZ06_03825 [Myxococcales bacterium]|nr:hypothetical protein [Myxococcales bacterium]
MAEPHDENAQQPDTDGEEQRPLSDREQAERLLRVARIFLLPFMFSWALAYVGSARGSDLVHFIGLGGVGLSMLALLLWLIH